MLSRMMYKPHISCLQKDIVTQNGITLTTDSEINKILLNGAEVYCIDTSKCYLYDEENKTLIEKSEINDILVDGEITPESVTLINNKVNNFIAEINDKIAQADIDKVVELANELDVLTDDISEINSSLNAITKNNSDLLELPLNSGFTKSDSGLNGYLKTTDNIVRIWGMVNGTLTPNEWNTIATFPTGFRPSNTVYGPCNVNGSFGIVLITAEGLLQVFTTNGGVSSRFFIEFLSSEV